jgi:hypothetical protein
MTTLPHICLALFISLSALQPGYGGTLSTGRRPAQTPSRRPLSASQAARKVLPSIVYIDMKGAGGKPGCYGSGSFLPYELIATNRHMPDCGKCQTVIAGSRHPTAQAIKQDES